MRVVALCGSDGSGKSTQVQKLCEFLGTLGIKYKRIHLLSPGSTVGSKSQRLPLLRKIHHTLRDLRGGKVASLIRVIAGLSYFFVDSWLTYISIYLKHSNSVVVFDRYFYDPLVIFASSFENPPQIIFQFAKILPKSKVTFIFEVPPQVAQSRKPEHDLVTLQRYHKNYCALAHILGLSTTDGTIDIDTLFAKISKTTMDKMHLSESFNRQLEAR